MTRMALIFPGQGSQFVGMGRKLADSEPTAMKTLEEADAVLGFPLTKMMFEGPEDELTLTENAQPAILAASVAAFRVLREKRPIHPTCSAGHSLGEYSALVCSGAMTFADALRRVRNRGRFMQEAVPPGRGAMAAILGLDRSAVEAICDAISAKGSCVAPANVNGAGQIVIAGEAAAVKEAGETARQKGAKRVLPLPVSAPFHCRLMQPAADRMKEVLDQTPLALPAFPVLSNVTGRPYEAAAPEPFARQVRSLLTQQIVSPVLWEDTVKTMQQMGAELFIELGPGQILTGLVRRIAPEGRSVSVDGPGGIGKVIEAIRG